MITLETMASAGGTARVPFTAKFTAPYMLRLLTNIVSQAVASGLTGENNGFPRSTATIKPCNACLHCLFRQVGSLGPAEYAAIRTSVRLLIVDDHPLFLEGFTAMLLRLRPDWTVGSASEGRAAIDAVRATPPDAVILDVFLPDRDGFDLLHDLRTVRPELPVILVSGRDHGAMAVRARASPASGFLPKTLPGPEFVERIEAVLTGASAFTEAGSTAGVPVLTMRQAQVLELLAEGHGNKEIRHRLGIAERTVRAHLTELFVLLGVHGRMSAVIRARELGLIA